MKKSKILLFSIVGLLLFSVSSFASATEEDYRIGVMPGVDHYGDDIMRKGLLMLDYGGTLRVDEMRCDTQPCSIVFASRDTDEVLCSVIYNNNQLTNSCTCFPVADYRYYNTENTNPFELFNITFLGNSCGSDTPVDPDPETPVDPDPETPTDGDNVLIPGMVGVFNNYLSILVDWLPAVIIISLGVFAIFVFFRYIFNSSRKSFKG